MLALMRGGNQTCRRRHRLPHPPPQLTSVSTSATPSAEDKLPGSASSHYQSDEVRFYCFYPPLILYLILSYNGRATVTLPINYLTSSTSHPILSCLSFLTPPLPPSLTTPTALYHFQTHTHPPPHASADSWHQFVPASLIESLGPKEVQRQSSFFELIGAERDYVRDLELVEEVRCGLVDPFFRCFPFSPPPPPPHPVVRFLTLPTGIHPAPQNRLSPYNPPDKTPRVPLRGIPQPSRYPRASPAHARRAI